MPTVSPRLKCFVQELVVRITKSDLIDYAIKEAKTSKNKIYNIYTTEIEFNDDDSITVLLKVKEDLPTLDTQPVIICQCNPKPDGLAAQFSSSMLCSQCQRPKYHYINGKLQNCCKEDGTCRSPKNLGKECPECGSEYHGLEYHNF